MTINYVIATYNGNIKRLYSIPPKEQTIQIHIQKLIEFKNNLNQISIMKASSNNILENYYNIHHLFSNNLNFTNKIKEVDCENYGYSMGQWLKAYEIDVQNDKIHDYYIFMEDDYCPNHDNFDELLIKSFEEQFPEKLGALCSHVVYDNETPPHFGGVFVTSKESLHHLYNFPYWERDPRKFLDRMTIKIDPKYDWTLQRNNYIGGYYQLAFSNMFRLSGIKHESVNNTFLYWCDSEMYSNGGTIHKLIYNDIVKKKTLSITSYTREDLDKALIVPIQISSINSIKTHTYLYHNFLQILDNTDVKQGNILLINFPIVVIEEILNKYKYELETNIIIIYILIDNEIYDFEYDDIIKSHENVIIIKNINDINDYKHIEYDYLFINHYKKISMNNIKNIFKFNYLEKIILTS
jgi:hypothetical protein